VRACPNKNAIILKELNAVADEKGFPVFNVGMSDENDHHPFSSLIPTLKTGNPFSSATALSSLRMMAFLFAWLFSSDLYSPRDHGQHPAEFEGG
jgi:hypothetical protein